MKIWAAENFARRPTLLVCGVGGLAHALTQVLVRSLLVDRSALANVTLGKTFGKTVLRLDEVKAILLICQSGMTVAEVLWFHGQLWKLVLSENGGDVNQQMRFIIFSSQEMRLAHRAQLARGLMVPELNGQHGYAFCEWAGGLKGLLDAMTTTEPTDAQNWEVLKRDDIRRHQITALSEALLGGNMEAVRVKSMAVWTQFKSLEIEIDSYCAPHCHTNGNQWRSWLRDAVTKDVTPEMVARGRSLLSLLNL